MSERIWISTLISNLPGECLYAFYFRPLSDFLYPKCTNKAKNLNRKPENKALRLRKSFLIQMSNVLIIQVKIDIVTQNLFAQK